MRGRVALIVVGVLVAGLLIALGLSAAVGHFFAARQTSRAPATIPATAPPATARFTPPRLLKVGVIVSDYSANGPNWMGRPYGHSYQYTVKALRDPNIKLIPLIEPGTGNKSDIAEAIAKDFGDAAPLDVTNASQLGTLDVIATADCANALPEALVAIESAVKGGVGLLHWCNLGAVNPGFGDPIVTRLTGLSEAAFGYTPDKFGVELEVINEHPILGKLKAGQKLKIQASGAYGVLKPPAVPLVRMTNPDELQWYRPSDVPETRAAEYYLIYTSALGKGRIVGCSFPAFREIPLGFNQKVGGRFLIRCVSWLSEKKAD